MENTVLPTDWRYRIKAATRDLIRAAGGLERAGDIVDKGKSQMSRYASPDHGDLIPIDAVLLLEHETGVATVTTVMAALNERVVDDRVTAVATEGVAPAHARAAAAMGQALSTAAAAMADGIITARESADILRSNRAAIEALTDVSKSVAPAGTGGPLQVVAS